MKVDFQNLDRLYDENGTEYKSIFERVMKRGYFILGDEVRDFEKEFSKYCSSRYCVGVASGLDALTLSLQALGFKQGDEVLVPSNTYIATWIAVSRAGLKPIPVEAEKSGFQIDPSEIRKHINDRTKAIMPVHLYYQTPDMDAINEIAVDFNLKVVADAAQGHGIKYKGKTVGSTAELEAFSFFPTKNLGAFGDAGAVVTDNEDYAERLLMLRNYGTQDKYISKIIGYNSRLDELQAAFLRTKLKRLEEWNLSRRKIAQRYLDEIDTKFIDLPEVKEYAVPNWHIFPIMTDFRDKLSKNLKGLGVQNIIHYPLPPYLQGAYSYMGIKKKDFPISSSIADRIISIPMHPYLTEEEVDYVISSVNDSMRKITLTKL